MFTWCCSAWEASWLTTLKQHHLTTSFCLFLTFNPNQVNSLFPHEDKTAIQYPVAKILYHLKMSGANQSLCQIKTVLNLKVMLLTSGNHLCWAIRARGGGAHVNRLWPVYSCHMDQKMSFYIMLYSCVLPRKALGQLVFGLPTLRNYWVTTATVTPYLIKLWGRRLALRTLRPNSG